MKKTLLFVALALVGLAKGAAAADGEIISLYYDDQTLVEVREAINNNDSAVMPAFEALKNYTDERFLEMEPLSITFGKTRTAPSMDPRDYISLSPYWWPDPEDPTAPYIRKDGERNPEVYDFPERESSFLIGDAVQALALVYYFTGEEQYAAKAAELIRTWFTDHTTGMNPNMTYAQYVPGMKEIRGTGIIDSERFLAAVNGAMIISGSESWTDQDEAKLKAWTHAYSYWLDNSVNGLTEAKAPNNHGLWFEVIRQICVLYSGDMDEMKRMVEEDMLPRMDSQITEEGYLHLELLRTIGLHYSTFALQAWCVASHMAEKVGVNVWEYQSVNGRNLSMAIDYLIPYWQDPESWPHMQIAPFNGGSGVMILREAGKALGNQHYLDLAEEMGFTVETGGPQGGGRGPSTTGLIRNLLYYDLLK